MKLTRTDMSDEIKQAKALTTSEDAVHGTLVGRRVYDPLLFAPGFVDFSARQYIFLRSYRLGISLEEAASKANLSPEQAERFLDKPATKRWLEDRAIKDHIKNEWEEPGKWWQKGDEWLNAPKEAKPTRTDIDIWKEFGDRIVVKPSRNIEGAGGHSITINISKEDWDDAQAHKKVVDAEVVSEE